MAIVANLHRPLIVQPEEQVEQDGQSIESTSQISASNTSLSSISLCSVTTAASSSAGPDAPPRKPPRKFHYTHIRQMAAPMSSSSAGPLRQPIRIAQPPPQVSSSGQQQHYATFNRLNQNCTPMTTTFPSNVTDATTTFPHYNSVPTLHNPNMVHRPNVSSASSSTLIHHPIQQQRRRDSVDSSTTTNQTHKMSYNSLMETAVAQQRQIDANACEMEDSRQLISSTIGTAVNDKRSTGNVGQQVIGLKNRIAHDEREMAKLGAVQREARQLAHHNQLQKRELAELENAYAHDDVQLRKAVDKVDVLRKQLDLLYQRRASAASAAIAQQRKVNGDLNSNTNPSTSSLNNLQMNCKPNSLAPVIKNLSQQLQQRPQASVGPFQFSNLQKENSNIEDELKKLPSYDQVDSAVNSSGLIKTPMNHHLHPEPSQQQQHKKTVRAPPPPFAAPTTTSGMSTFGKEIGNHSKNSYLCMDETHEQRLARGKPDQLSLRGDSLTAMKRRSWAQAEGGTPNGGESENIWRYLVEEQKKGRTHISFADIIAARKPTANASASATIRSGFDTTSNTAERLRYQHADIATACATLPPTATQLQKPRPKPIVDVPEEDDFLDVPSTASNTPLVAAPHSPSKTEETTAAATYTVSSVQTSAINQNAKSVEVSLLENTRKIDEEHQNLKTTEEVVVGNVSAREETNKQQCTIIEESMPEEEPEKKVTDDGEELFEQEDDDEPSEFIIIDTAELGNHEEASSTTTDEASSTVSGDEPAFEELSSSNSRIPGHNYKGILRTPGKQHHNRRVVFDQVVLFLDVAYEGEYEMLVQLAKNIPDISFLIDNNADVNALDSDGWSPLHCAASCNNLVMLKQLIENGACVFATTISKTETAANLFDETHEYEAGAEYIELVEKCMGWSMAAKSMLPFPMKPKTRMSCVSKREMSSGCFRGMTKRMIIFT
uniref:Uncharacterized protein n=1 Tax=Ditylenchus dipsaci TaxID=166011 RepID=A0A915DP08_9BILA